MSKPSDGVIPGSEISAVASQLQSAGVDETTRGTIVSRMAGKTRIEAAKVVADELRVLYGMDPESRLNVG